jgi:hypothetical protein
MKTGTKNDVVEELVAKHCEFSACFMQSLK